jgi:hypothetical protein
VTKSDSTAGEPPATEPFNWRALLPIHPAAELFPLMAEAELRETAEGIWINGLRLPVVTWSAKEDDDPQLIDGRNRLDALARHGLLYETSDHHIGLKNWTGTEWAKLSGERIKFEHNVGCDPYALAMELNVHRRHLNTEQKRDLIAELIKANPEKSNKQIADQAGVVSYPTVTKVREALEESGDVEKFTTSIDTKGRRQPRKKKSKAKASKPKSNPEEDDARESARAFPPLGGLRAKATSKLGQPTAKPHAQDHDMKTK